MPFKVYHDTVIWRDNIQIWSTISPKETVGINQNVDPNKEKELQPFFGIMNYLGKFSPLTAEVVEPLRKLTSSNVSGLGTTPTKAIQQ